MIGTLLKVKRSKTIDPRTVGEISFRCRPWDLDLFLEMNNGRVLTLYDLGRFDLLLRMVLDKIMRQNRWGLVVASSTVRYRHRIRRFDRVTICTQFAGADNRWVSISQTMWAGGRAVSAVLLRTGVTSKGKAITPALLIDAMKLETAPSLVLGERERQWVATENARPWPPTP